MKILFTLLFFSSFAYSHDSFETESAELAKKLKSNLMSELQKKISASGPEEAIDFCHLNVKTIAKSLAGDLAKKYKFGRTSHRVRNQENIPNDWMKVYLDKFNREKTTKPVIHNFSDGKRAYLEPLFVQPMCLSCHGTAVTGSVKAEIKKRYPNDKATGFKVGDFRGFIWILEK